MHVGTTLFSFTDEWRARHMELTEVLERVAGLELGPDIEVVGYQSFRGLPAPREAEIDRFAADVLRLSLRPTAFGVYLDIARGPDRWLRPHECVAELSAQLRTAHQLGFPMARATLGMDPHVIEAVLPLLEKLDLVLTFEIQGNHTPGAPAVVDLLDWLGRHPGAPVGLTLDTSVAMGDLPDSYRRAMRDLGMTSHVGEVLEATWRAQGAPHSRMAAFQAAVTSLSVPEPVLAQAVTAFIRFGHGSAEDWRDVLPWVRHVHAKFWDWEDVEKHVFQPQRRFLEMLTGAGYAGSIVSEFGGTAWLDRDHYDVFDLVTEHVSWLRATAELLQVTL